MIIATQQKLRDLHNHRGGFTLLEMIGVVCGLVVLMSLGTAMLVAVFKIQKTATVALNRLGVQGQLADQFRADVESARSTPDRWNEYKAGPSCLVLRMSNDKHVAYRWQNGQLERLEQTGTARSRQQLPLGSANAALEFIRSGADHPLLILRLRELPQRARTIQIEIAAALGGDLR